MFYRSKERLKQTLPNSVCNAKQNELNEVLSQTGRTYQLSLKCKIYNSLSSQSIDKSRPVRGPHRFLKAQNATSMSQSLMNK